MPGSRFVILFSMSQMSGISSQISDSDPSYFSSQVRGLGSCYQLSSLRSQVLIGLGMVFEPRFEVSDLRSQVSELRSQVPDYMYQIPQLSLVFSAEVPGLTSQVLV